MSERLVKLVRDRIADVAGHSTVEYKPIGDPELVKQELRKKLVEEALEYLMDPSASEAADVWEVLCCLIKVDLDSTLGDVVLLASCKRTQRGSFLEGVGMYVDTQATEHG